jgi:hypothetical protein
VANYAVSTTDLSSNQQLPTSNFLAAMEIHPHPAL